jgi:hypothetical protein
MPDRVKPLTLEDFNLSPEDLKTIVEGAQKFLPPDAVDTEPETQTS